MNHDLKGLEDSHDSINQNQEIKLISKIKIQTMSKEMKLIPELRFPEFVGDGEWVERKLGDEEISIFVKNKVNSKKLTLNNYISTDNMLPDYSGITKASKLPITSRVTEFINGDILISNIRPYLKKVWKSDRNGGASNDVLVFRSGSGVTSDFLETIIKNDTFIDYVMQSSKGVKMPRGDKDSMLKYLTRIPKKPEQQKIAACLSSLDELITAHKDKLDALKDHKKGLLQNLFPNNLNHDSKGLKDDHDLENGKKSGNQANPKNHGSDNVPKVRFPEFVGDGEWVIRSVEKNIDLISGIALKSKELSEDNSGTPILRGINITEGQIRHSEEIDKFYLGDTSGIERYIVEKNDIVIGMDGSKVGKNVALISNQDAGAILIQRVARIRAINSDVTYLYQHFLSNSFRSYVDNVNTSSGIPHISAKQIRDFEIGFPPTINEQQKIAACLSSVDELITAQKEKIEQLQQHKKGLMQGLFPKVIG